jgi:hypothetical protein
MSKTVITTDDNNAMTMPVILQVLVLLLPGVLVLVSRVCRRLSRDSYVGILLTILQPVLRYSSGSSPGRSAKKLLNVTFVTLLRKLQTHPT